ncbi:MAG: metallophosphoesterase family protein [Chloroflexota bacterium]|nr:metallophosphoesterase family protein [Chloroflexota bacterium]
MRLAVFSDIHGNISAFEAALKDLETLGGADYTWFLGDLAAFGSRPAACIQRVKAIWDAAQPPKPPEGSEPPPFPHTPPKVRAIRGNTDRYLVNGSRPKSTPAENADDYAKRIQTIQDRDANLNWALTQLAFEDYDFLRKLGGECDLHAKDYGDIIGYHAVPGDDEGDLTPESTDEEAADFLLDREGRAGIGGHIHKQMDRTLSLGGWRVINVGSVGLSFDMPGYAQWGLFTVEKGALDVDLRAVAYDVEAYIRDLETCGLPAPAWFVSKLRPTDTQS